MTVTQIELERQMYDFGRSRAERMMSKNEEAGRASSNPYAAAIYRRFVLPLAAMIQDDLDNRKPGRRKAHAVLLEGMDAEALSYLTVRSALGALLGGGTNMSGGRFGDYHPTARQLALDLGKSIYHEKCLALFAEADPALFYTLVNDLDRRLSKSERHRMTVFKMQAEKNGVPVPDWGTAGKTQVGAYLLDLLEALGMVETQQSLIPSARKEKIRASIEVKMTTDTLELVSRIKDHVSATTPYYLPCVEKPMDWVSIRDGGFHTKEMRRLQPFAIKSAGLRSEEDFEEGDVSTVLGAINACQSTAWQVNGVMLDTIRQVAKHFDMEEILSQAEFPAPPKPDWLSDQKFDHMTPPQQEEFIHWKREKAQWFTEMKLRGTKYGRFFTATSVADKFRDFDEIYFVYFADFRGRLYAQTTGISPQGSDMQKALIRFAKGKALDTVEAERWFCIHGANKFGFDKASLDDRVQWTKTNHNIIMACAEDPISNEFWQEADTPLQFLAWCFEYAEWRYNPHTFESRLPIGMDGTCNGLQNFSAMLRDEVGGKATNLVPGALPNDIYKMVAELTEHLLRLSEPDDAGYRDKWLAHGINRTLVKRSVMTLPYGSTRFSCADFIVGDYMKMGKCPEFAKEEYGKAAQFLSHFVWDAIGDVVVKAREAMNWLQQCAKTIIKDGEETVRWVSPSGFPVVQLYAARQEHRIRTHLCGSAFLRLEVDTDIPDRNRHKNGVAPNFVHSCDAAHLHLVAVAAAAEGMDLALIHDDYGTHAADAARFYRIIREVFVAMYEGCDPLKEFAARYDMPPPPEMGTLNLRDVLNSAYFFS
ncbi:DNA-dependent RNA polymerase [Caulobacter phage Cd1]|uniref:DNA-directed RNA polymerase n=1 Tax=Caulobacter phage Cd1 TaxID=718008 RepID=F1ADQ9_9CAUD|nr:DNA-dependent RNA polymerase [Caulobacter phage Cd1]